MTGQSFSRALLKGGLFLALAAGLAACGGGGGGGSSTPATITGVDRFGTGFAADFRTASTATPPVPSSGDIIPLSLTTPPLPLT